MAAETGPDHARQPVSLWAVAALVCAISFVCPIAPLLGLLLGAVALFDVRRRNRSGRRLAVAALAVSVLAIAGWGLLAGWWNTHARQPMLYGPVEAIAAGQRGDIAAFRAAFVPGGDEHDAVAFIAAVTDRYGKVVGSSQRETDKPASTLRHATIPYRFLFETGPVDVDAEFVVANESGGGLVLRFAWVEIHDPAAGDLRYPPQP